MENDGVFGGRFESNFNFLFVKMHFVCRIISIKIQAILWYTFVSCLNSTNARLFLIFTFLNRFNESHEKKNGDMMKNGAIKSEDLVSYLL